MIWFFAGLFITFFLANIWLVLDIRRMNELNEKQHEKIIELVRVAAQWQARARDAERALQ